MLGAGSTQNFKSVVCECKPRTVTQQALEAGTVGRSDGGFAFERAAIVVSREFARRWCGGREIVEDAGFAGDGVGQDELREIACVVALVVGGWRRGFFRSGFCPSGLCIRLSCTTECRASMTPKMRAVVGATLDVRGDRYRER